MKRTIWISVFCSLWISQPYAFGLAQSPQVQVIQAPQAVQQAVMLPAPQLDSLVAPIALYPDPLLSQTLAASTYPIEIVEAAQWLRQNPTLTGPALQDAARRQDWDPSVQALVVFPDVLQRLADNIRWTTDLGNAFLAQQSDVMDAVQRMRSKAVASGNLATNPETVVRIEPQGATTIVEVEPADPQVVYVPVYDPFAIWGPAYYPYPAFYYYSRPTIIVTSGFIGYPRGIFIGGLFSGWNGWSGWGWRPHWFGRTVIVNNDFFNRYGYRTVVAGANRGSGPVIWRHDPVHRWTVPYSNREVEARFRNNNNDVRRFQAGRSPAVSQPAPAARVLSAPAARVPSARGARIQSEPTAPLQSAHVARTPSNSQPAIRSFASSAPAPSASVPAVGNGSRFNERERVHTVPTPNASDQGRSAPDLARRPSTPPVQSFRGGSRGNAPQQAPGQFRSEESRSHGSGEHSASRRHSEERSGRR